MRKPARLFWNPAHRRRGATCRRRAPAPLQGSVQASASLRPWTPSLTKQVEHRIFLCLVFSLPFPAWFNISSSYDTVSLGIWNALTACFPTSYLWKAMIRNMFVLGFQQLHPVQSPTVYIWLFFYFQIIQILETSIKFLIIIPHVSSLPNYCCVSEFANIDWNGLSGLPKYASCLL